MDADEGESTTCLFCSDVFASIELAIEHLNNKHQVNLPQLKQKFQMDQYAFIKLINYIRTSKINPEQLLLTDKPLWNDEKYLKPLEYESWLCYDYDALRSDAATTSNEQELLNRITEQAKLLQQASEDMERMRFDYKELLQKVHTEAEKSSDQKSVAGNNSIVRNTPTLDKEYFNSYSHFGIHHEMLSDRVICEICKIYFSNCNFSFRLGTYQHLSLSSSE